MVFGRNKKSDSKTKNLDNSDSQNHEDVHLNKTQEDTLNITRDAADSSSGFSNGIEAYWDELETNESTGEKQDENSWKNGLSKEEAIVYIDSLIDEKISKMATRQLELDSLMEEWERQKKEAREKLHSVEGENRRGHKKTQSVVQIVDSLAKTAEKEMGEIIDEAVAETGAACGIVDKIVENSVENEHVSSDLDITVDKAVEKVKNVVEKLCLTAFSTKDKVKNALTTGGQAFRKALSSHTPKPVKNVINQGSETVFKYAEILFNQASIKEAKLSSAAGSFITKLDGAVDKAALGCRQAGIFGLKKYDSLQVWAQRHQRKLIIGFGCSMAVFAGVTLFLGSITAYEYRYNGRPLGIVKDQREVYDIVDIIGDKLSYAYNVKININKDEDISFVKVYGFDLAVDSKEDILNSLTYMRNMTAFGYGIYVEQQQVGIVDSKETAEAVLAYVKGLYTEEKEGVTYKSITFEEAVSIREVETKLGNIKDSEDIVQYLLTGAEKKSIHVVEPGQTFSEIAKIYGMKSSELMDSNPEVVPEKLQIGQEITLTQDSPLVTVKSVETAVYNEPIPFDIAYEETGSLFENETTVKSNGTEGERKITAEVERVNGIEVSRNEISSEVLKEPVDQVVLQGTKEVPKLVGTGTYIYPTRGGRLSSSFGSRWGRMHNGIDLAAPVGTPIYASDGGTVTFAGYKGSFGYMVKINHGGNVETLYAHCSKLLVKTGQKVYQGQEIAKVGNTGNSTGPHCHFEVQVNGVPKNPMNYL